MYLCVTCKIDAQHGKLPKGDNIAIFILRQMCSPKSSYVTHKGTCNGLYQQVVLVSNIPVTMDSGEHTK